MSTHYLSLCRSFAPLFLLVQAFCDSFFIFIIIYHILLSMAKVWGGGVMYTLHVYYYLNNRTAWSSTVAISRVAFLIVLRACTPQRIAVSLAFAPRALRRSRQVGVYWPKFSLTLDLQFHFTDMRLNPESWVAFISFTVYGNRNHPYSVEAVITIECLDVLVYMHCLQHIGQTGM